MSLSNRAIKLGINGFGRIGRQAFKLALDHPELEVVGINDLTSPTALAYLLKHDSNYGYFNRDITADENHIIVEGKKIPVSAEKDPAKLPWKALGADVILECTGRFTSSEKSAGHLEAGAKRVIISAPAKDEGTTKTILLGVNEDQYNGEAIISNASCTTNCIAPVTAVLHSKFGIEKMMMTTIHSYTAEQNLVDGPPPGEHSNDMRRARAAAENIVPTTTGAAISTTQVIPELKGLFNGLAFRVPTPVGSLSDFSVLIKKQTTIEEVNQVFIEASNNPLYKGKLVVSDEQLVSSDIIGNPASCIIDLSLTQVVDGNFVKVIAWYDNEFGYSNRLVEQAILVGQSIK